MFLRGLSRSVFLATLASLAVALFAGGVAHADTIYVDDDAPAGGDGTTWTTAYASLQDALAVATSADEIRIAGGLYKPASKTQSFVLVSGAEVYGGFAGLADPNAPDARDIVVYETILSGDLLGDDDPSNLFANRSDNCYHVVIAGNTSADTRLDGVTTEGGYAVAYDGQPNGGGVYAIDCSATFVDCTIRRNVTCVGAPDATVNPPPAGNGGGVYCHGGAPTFDACTIQHNAAGDGKSVPWDASLFDNVPSNGGHGGGGYFESANPALNNCLISGNRSGAGGSAGYYARPGADAGSGGGLYLSQAEEASFLGCEFSQNLAGNGGKGGTPQGDSGNGADGGIAGDAGAVLCVNASATFQQCTFTANQAGAGGQAGRGGKYDGDGGNGGRGGHAGALYGQMTDVEFQACVFTTCQSGQGGGSGGGLTGGDGGTAGDGGAIHCQQSTASFDDCDFVTNQTGAGAGGAYGSIFNGGAGARGGHGGAVYANATPTTWLNCTLIGNSTGAGGYGGTGASGKSGSPGGSGGAAHLSNSDYAHFDGCTVSQNHTGAGGHGGDAMSDGAPQGGMGGPGGDGGGLFITLVSDFTLSCATITDNVTGSGGDGGSAEWGYRGGGGRGAGRGGSGGCGAGLYSANTTGAIVASMVVRNTTGAGARGGSCFLYSGGDGGTGGHGAGCYTTGTTRSLSLLNCLVGNNLTGNGGDGGMSEHGYGNGGTAGNGAGMQCKTMGAIANCTFANNMTGTPGVPDGALATTGGLQLLSGSAAEIDNGVFCGNVAGSGTVQTQQISGTPTAIEYNCVQGWTGSLGGTGNIGADPLFADPNNADYHLSAGSPCIDAGNNAYVDPYALDLDGNDRRFDDPATADCPQGGCGTAPIVDMGAYEFGAPPADCNSNGIHDALDTDICRGDANCDGQIDFADINAFVNAVVYGVYCDGTGLNADLARDCSVGFEDINPFVELLTTNTLPIACP